MFDDDGLDGTPDLVGQVIHDIQSNSSLGIESAPVIFGYLQPDRSSIVLSFRVMCAENYYGQDCSQFCNENTNCSGRGQCINGANSFTCACNIGYTGEHCDIGINECESKNVTCGRHGQCVDKVAGYTCVCDPGFTGEICSEEVVVPTDEPGEDKTPNLTAVLGGAIGSLVVLVLLLLVVVAAMALVIGSQRKKGEQHLDKSQLHVTVKST